MTTVLIAEDNLINRELLREILEARGCAVVEAGNGQEVLNVICQNQPDVVPDVIVMDIGMPVMDGYATVGHIRQNPRFASLPIVAVSAYAMRGDREKILSSGFNGYVSKPVNPQSLVEELSRVLLKLGS